MGKTQNKITKNLSLVLEEIQKTITAVGESGFLKILKESREDSELTYQNDVSKIVIKIVINV